MKNFAIIIIEQRPKVLRMSQWNINVNHRQKRFIKVFDSHWQVLLQV